MLTTAKEAFKKQRWEFITVDGRDVIQSDFDAHHTRIRVHVQAFPQIHGISVVANASAQVPSARQGLIAELLMRTNQQLTIGNFEMDYDHGAVMFRATNIFEEGKASEAIIASLVHSAVAEVDRITPFVTLVLRMSTEELGRLNMKTFLMREDLLPPVPEDPEAS